MTQICLVAALDRNAAIGRDNGLPWHLPDDLKRFKALTLGHPILMGRKTAESLGRALPKRLNLVLTRRDQAPFAGMQAVPSLQAALAVASANAPVVGTPVVGQSITHDLTVIGGGEVYAQALPLATRMFLTHVDTVVEGADTFFPAWAAGEWEVLSRQWHPADATHPFAFEFVDYRRRQAPRGN